MAEGLSSLSVLPWIWSIEALASDKEVDASLIHDVIEMSPPLSDDLGKNMIEMLALRCLEGLYGSSEGSMNKVSLALDSKIGFRPSESCESVLGFISGKTPSNLRVTGAEQLKLDIHSFIMHKRDSMAKCTLQQLKDSILEGTHKYVDSLKDISGLACTNECATMPSDDDDRNVCPQMRTVTRSNGDKLSENVPLNLIPSPSNRDRFESGTETVVADIPESLYDLKAKKRKHCDSSAIESEYGPSAGVLLRVTTNEVEKLSGCDGYGNEEIDVVMSKNPFLSHGASAMADWKERNFCVKCNEGGELLACKSHGCNMVIHEDCLGISARFNNEGDFCCPFCTYSVAISEYLEAKKTTSLARQRLASFIGPNFECWSNGVAEGLHMEEGDPRQGEDENLEVRNGHLGETEGNQASDT